MHGTVVNVYSPEKLKELSPEDATNAINADIYENAWERQRQAPVAFRYERPAEGLECALVVCPGCGAISSFKTEKAGLCCTRCGMRTSLDEYGFFKGETPFATVREWDEWQKAELARMVNDHMDVPVPEVKGKLTRLSEDERSKGETAYAKADIARGTFRFGETELRFEDITDMSMVKTNRLLFTCESGYFEFKSKKGPLRQFLLIWRAAKEL